MIRFKLAAFALLSLFCSGCLPAPTDLAGRYLAKDGEELLLRRDGTYSHLWAGGQESSTWRAGEVDGFCRDVIMDNYSSGRGGEEPRKRYETFMSCVSRGVRGEKILTVDVNEPTLNMVSK
jgi:hypothetical protein